VSDTGIGMIHEALASAFDLLTQVEARADRIRGGLGIGLALVRQIVELKGGGVIAGSTCLGQGK
jgi:signal transduction histidine kinase